MRRSGSDVFFGASLILVAMPVLAQQASVSADLQVPLILKVLTYDRKLERGGDGELFVGVVYSASAVADKAVTEITEALKKHRGKTIKKLPFDFEAFVYTSPEQLERVIASKKIDVLYVVPGFTGDLAKVLDVAKAKGVTTATGFIEYVEKGVSVGIGMDRDRPGIWINVTASRLEGSDFDVSLLRIAHVVKK